MKLVIFGLTISSSWGNGHATLWRGLCRALIGRGHEVVFFERNLPYYAAHRDMEELPGGDLVIYESWEDVEERVRLHFASADVAIITSYCRDALVALEFAGASSALRVFYDLDAPVTLARLGAGEPVPYIGERGLRDYELVLSYTGGSALGELQSQLGAPRVEPLYGSVDPDRHYPVHPKEIYHADLSYLGTYAADRQDQLVRLLIESARRRPQSRFVIGGAQYPDTFPWTPNLYFVRHLAPPDHAAFYCSGRLTLNVTREAMAACGWCPSGRLFEAAACGTPIVSDWFEGLDHFFEPGAEIVVAHSADDVLQAMDRSDHELGRIGSAARERVFQHHTAMHRVARLETLLDEARCPKALEV